jgi:hypothetical protein
MSNSLAGCAPTRRRHFIKRDFRKSDWGISLSETTMPVAVSALRYNHFVRLMLNKPHRLKEMRLQKGAWLLIFCGAR